MKNMQNYSKNTDLSAESGRSVLIAMSGGGDSSVAALLLKNSGYALVGATMKLYEKSDIAGIGEQFCCTTTDTDDAQKIANRLNFPHCVLNFQEDFEKQVIQHFISAYERGETPNPCIDCNRFMKFSLLYQRAKEMKLSYIATGHYADIELQNDRFLLKKAVDLSKDQSYVLYSLTQDQLAHTLFPLGCYTKAQVRQIAEENGFMNAKKRDSQDICFVPDGDYASFIRRKTGKTYPSGDFIDENGAVLGVHKGIIQYTIGQRRGLGLALSKPMYVADKNMEKNQVVLAENSALFRREMDVKEVNWIALNAPTGTIKANVKIRYSHREQAAQITPESKNCAHVIFEQPQRAITKGQAAVFYDGNYVLGGGVIC